VDFETLLDQCCAKILGYPKLSKLERDVIVHELYVSTIVVHEVKKGENLRNSVTDSFNEECSLPEDHKPGCDQVDMNTFDIVANQSALRVIGVKMTSIRK
jgi:hypothetical protein